MEETKLVDMLRISVFGKILSAAKKRIFIEKTHPIHLKTKVMRDATQKNNSYLTRFSSFMAVILLLTNFYTNVPIIPIEGDGIKTASAASQNDLNNTIGQLKAEMDTLNAKLSQKRNEKASLQNEVAIYDAQIQAINLKIQSTNLEIEATTNEINKTKAEIVRMMKELEIQKESLRENIRVLYEEGRISTVEIVVSSENFSSFLNKNEYLSTLQEEIKGSLEKINALKRDLEAKKQNLDAKKKDWTI